MSKEIQDRRKNSSNVPDEKKAKVVKAEKKKKGFPFLKVVLSLFIVVAVCTLVLLVVNAVTNSYYNKIEGVKVDEATKKAESITSKYYDYDRLLKDEEYALAFGNALLNFAEASTTVASSENIHNYLMVTSVGGELRTTVLLSLDKLSGEVTYINVATRALVYIPTVGVGPMFDAYKWGGAALLARTVQENFGLEVNGYVDMDLDSASELVGQVGGITIDADAALVEKLNVAIDSYNARMNLTGDSAVKHVELGADNKVALNELQTLAYVRGNLEGSREATVKGVLNKLSASLGNGGMSMGMDCLDVVTSNMEVSLDKEDFTSAIKVGNGVFANVTTDSVVLGDKDAKSISVNNGEAMAIDYEGDRAEIISLIYGE